MLRFWENNCMQGIKQLGNVLQESEMHLVVVWGVRAVQQSVSRLSDTQLSPTRSINSMLEPGSERESSLPSSEAHTRQQSRPSAYLCPEETITIWNSEEVGIGLETSHHLSKE